MVALENRLAPDAKWPFLITLYLRALRAGCGIFSVQRHKKVTNSPGKDRSNEAIQYYLINSRALDSTV